MSTETVTITPEIRAAIDTLNALPAEQHRDAITALLNDSGPVVKSFRTRAFGNGKKAGEEASGSGAAKLQEAQDRIQELEGQVADLTAKVPEAKATEERLQKQYEKKLEAERKRAEAAEGTLTKERSSRFRTQFSAELADVADKDYRDEVLANRYADRYRVQPDGSWQVLRPGEDTPYEAATEAEAVKLLAADVAKLVPPKFRLAHGESGGGITTGSGGGGQAPAKVEKERIDNARQAVQGAF